MEPDRLQDRSLVNEVDHFEPSASKRAERVLYHSVRVLVTPVVQGLSKYYSIDIGIEDIQCSMPLNDILIEATDKIFSRATGTVNHHVKQAGPVKETVPLEQVVIEKPRKGIKSWKRLRGWRSP